MLFAIIGKKRERDVFFFRSLCFIEGRVYLGQPVQTKLALSLSLSPSVSSVHSLSEQRRRGEDPGEVGSWEDWERKDGKKWETDE